MSKSSEKRERALAHDLKDDTQNVTPEQQSKELSPDENLKISDIGITVKQSKLDSILARLDSLESENILLRSSVSRSKLEQAETKRRPGEKKRCFLKVMKNNAGKDALVIGWKSSSENRMIIDPRTHYPIGEVLRATYYFNDMSNTGEIDQVLFTKSKEVAFATILEKQQGKNGQADLFVLQMLDRKWGSAPITVSSVFVNP